MPVRLPFLLSIASALVPLMLAASVARAQEPAADPGMAAPAPEEPVPAPHKRHRRAALDPADASGPVSDLAGRYAVMREKRDTGCMVTLDAARIKGGERAQLAPGCRDQGIVVFDPTAWQIVKGELVLTARAGHKTHLSKDKFGVWQKDEKDGGKPLGLKRL